MTHSNYQSVELPGERIDWKRVSLRCRGLVSPRVVGISHKNLGFSDVGQDAGNDQPLPAVNIIR
ncbi:MAG: hypothetical protein ACTHWH_00155 [Marinobacter sp.]